MSDRWQLDHATYRPGQRSGHYESFYQRANHPSRPLAFWIRYTIFVPAADPDAAVGELWAVAFDGETHEHAVAKEVRPLADCRFAADRFDVAVGAGRARAGPAARDGPVRSAWDLAYDGTDEPAPAASARPLPTRVPRAKSLVPLPMARFTGAPHRR